LQRCPYRQQKSFTSPNIVLHEELGTNTGIDSVTVVLEEVVEKVAGTEAEGGSAGVEVSEVAVGVGHSDSLVFVAVGIGMADERSLEVVMELAVGNGDTSGTVCNVEETIIKVFAVI
jgi:hypothetical protein